VRRDHECRSSHDWLHAVLRELHGRLNQHRAAAGNFRRALHLAQVGPEQNYLTRMIERAEGADTAN
jgi:RNA polymerase sigma-70 factor (ECF subfamily)